MQRLRLFKVSGLRMVASSFKKRHTAFRMNTTATLTMTLPAPDLRNDVLIPGSIILLGFILALLISL